MRSQGFQLQRIAVICEHIQSAPVPSREPGALGGGRDEIAMRWVAGVRLPRRSREFDKHASRFGAVFDDAEHAEPLTTRSAFENINVERSCQEPRPRKPWACCQEKPVS
jgi:hypothetical protein